MNAVVAAAFGQVGLFPTLASMSIEELDELEFGVIGFDAAGIVRVYNLFESKLAGLPRERVLGHALFTNLAPCMNNFMVAQRFDEGGTLDVTLDYVLTLRMRPKKVKLRLLSATGKPLRYVLVERRP